MQSSSLASSISNILSQSGSITRGETGHLMLLAFAVWKAGETSLIPLNELIEHCFGKLLTNAPEFAPILEKAELGFNKADSSWTHLAAVFSETLTSLSYEDFIEKYFELEDLLLKRRSLDRSGKIYLPTPLLELALQQTDHADPTKPLLVTTTLNLSARSIHVLKKCPEAVDIVNYSETWETHFHNLVLNAGLSVKKGIVLADGFLNDRVLYKRPHYGRIISFPPFGHNDRQNLSLGSLFFSDLPDVGEFLKTGGVSWTVLPQSWAFSLREQELRKTLVCSGYLREVISLPENTFSGARIRTVAIVCSPPEGKDELVRLRKISPGFDEPEESLEVDRAEIVEQDFQLVFDRYLPPVELDEVPGGTVIRLGDILRLFPREMAQADDLGKVVKIRDLSDADQFSVSKFEDLPIETFGALDRPGRLQKVSGPCLLVSTILGRGLKVDWYASEGPYLFIRRPDILAFSLRETATCVLPSWLLMALGKPEVLEQLNRVILGSVQPRFRERDFFDVRIVIPDLESQQKREVENVRKANLASLAKAKGFEDLLEEMRLHHRQDLKIKKHTMSQLFPGIYSGISMVKRALNRANIADEDRLQIEKALGYVERNSRTLAEQVSSITAEDLLQRLEPLNLRAALDSLRNHNGNFSLRIEIDQESFLDEQDSEDDILDPIIYLSRKDFDDLMRNILTNAEVHGFTEVKEGNEVLIRVAAGLDSKGAPSTILEVSNNGRQLPKGMDTNRFIKSGEKGGRTGNQGLGGNHINRIMTHAGGSLQLISSPDSEYPVSLKLFFPFS